MNYSMIFYIIGWILDVEAALLVPSLAVSLIYHESCALAFFITIVLCLTPRCDPCPQAAEKQGILRKGRFRDGCLKLDRHEYHGFHPVPLKRIHHKSGGCPV